METTSSITFETRLHDRLKSIIAARYPTLRVTFPPRDIITGPTPDILIANPATGQRFLADVKSGIQADRMSSFSDTYVRAMRDAAGVKNADVVLITTADPPAYVQEGLRMDGLTWWTVCSPQEALARLEPVLDRLAGVTPEEPSPPSAAG